MRKLLLPLMLLLVGCGESKFQQTADYLIAVDSISAPQTISTTEPFTIRVYATVGPNACFSFRRFEVLKDPSKLEALVLGRFVSTGQCAQGEVRLNGEPLQVSPPFQHPFTVTFYQPSGATLVKEIAVR